MMYLQGLNLNRLDDLRDELKKLGFQLADYEQIRLYLENVKKEATTFKEQVLLN